LVDGFNRNRSENKAVVFHDGELFGSVPQLL